MTEIEAKNLVAKIGSTFANSRFDTVKRQAYVEALEKLDMTTVELSVSKLMLTNKFCPSIAEIYEVYQAIIKGKNRYEPTLKQPKVACEVCGGWGFLVRPRMINSLPYDYLYHCECKAGLRWAYDGTILQENQSDFRIPSITEYHNRSEQQISA